MKIKYENKQQEGNFLQKYWSLKCYKPNINPTIPLKIGFSLVKYTYPKSWI